MLEKTQAYFFFGLLAVVAIIVFFIALPYLPALIFAIALAVIFQPLYARLQKISLGQRRLAAWLTLLIVAVVVLLPLSLIGFQIVKEAGSAYGQLSGGSGGLQGTLDRLAPHLGASYQAGLQKVLNWMVDSVGTLFSNTLSVLLNVFICFIALYYFLVDGPKIYAWLLNLSPLPENYDNMIVDRMSRTMNSVIRGTLVVCLLQGILVGLGFAIFGLSNPALWGSATAVAALIPGIGAALVIVPAGIYLLITTSATAGIGFLVAELLAMFFVANILGPNLMRRGAKIHPLLIFIAVIGGLSVFGPLGFLIGPLALSLLLSLLEIYSIIRKVESKGAA